MILQAMNDEVFDEHLKTPEHKSKVKKDSSESIDNFLSAMRRYEMAYFVNGWIIENISIPHYSPNNLNLYF